MSKTLLITMMALIAAVTAEPYPYISALSSYYGAPSLAAYTSAVVPGAVPAAAVPAVPGAWPAAYSAVPGAVPAAYASAPAGYSFENLSGYYGIPNIAGLASAYSVPAALPAVYGYSTFGEYPFRR